MITIGLGAHCSEWSLMVVVILAIDRFGTLHAFLVYNIDFTLRRTLGVVNLGLIKHISYTNLTLYYIKFMLPILFPLRSYYLFFLSHLF